MVPIGTLYRSNVRYASPRSEPDPQERLETIIDKATAVLGQTVVQLRGEVRLQQLVHQAVASQPSLSCQRSVTPGALR